MSCLKSSKCFPDFIKNLFTIPIFQIFPCFSFSDCNKTVNWLVGLFNLLFAILLFFHVFPLEKTSELTIQYLKRLFLLLLQHIKMTKDSFTVFTSIWSYSFSEKYCNFIDIAQKNILGVKFAVWILQGNSLNG